MFDALENARRIIHQLSALVAEIARHDADLARQLRKAATSIPFNVAEGRQRAGKDREHHYRVALGSAAEAVEALHVALAWRYIADAGEALALLDRGRAMLWRLTH